MRDEELDSVGVAEVRAEFSGDLRGEGLVRDDDERGFVARDGVDDVGHDEGLARSRGAPKARVLGVVVSAEVLDALRDGGGLVAGRGERGAQRRTGLDVVRG